MTAHRSSSLCTSVPMLTLAVLLLAGLHPSQAAPHRVVTYNQTQVGKYNAQADIENVLILVVPPRRLLSNAAISILDLRKSLPMPLQRRDTDQGFELDEANVQQVSDPKKEVVEPAPVEELVVEKVEEAKIEDSTTKVPEEVKAPQQSQEKPQESKKPQEAAEEAVAAEQQEEKKEEPVAAPAEQKETKVEAPATAETPVKPAKSSEGTAP